MGAAVKRHVGVKHCLIEIAIFRARCANANLDLVFDKIGQVVIDAIAGDGFLAAVTVSYSPVNSTVDEKKVDSVSFGVSDFGELEAAGRFFVIIVTQYEEKTGHERISLVG